MPRDSNDGIFQLILIALFVGVPLIIQLLRKLTGSEEKEKAESRAKGGNSLSREKKPGLSAEAALEQLFRKQTKGQGQERREPQRTAAQSQDTKAQSLEDFFENMHGRRAKPAARAAREVPAVQELAPEPRVSRLRPVAQPVSATYDPQKIVKARATIAKGKKPKRPRKKAAPQRRPATTPQTIAAFEKLERQDLIRAVIYSEVIGRPRGMSPYSGPQASE